MKTTIVVFPVITMKLDNRSIMVIFRSFGDEITEMLFVANIITMTVLLIYNETIIMDDDVLPIKFVSSYKDGIQKERQYFSTKAEEAIKKPLSPL